MKHIFIVSADYNDGNKVQAVVNKSDIKKYVRVFSKLGKCCGQVISVVEHIYDPCDQWLATNDLTGEYN